MKRIKSPGAAYQRVPDHEIQTESAVYKQHVNQLDSTQPLNFNDFIKPTLQFCWTTYSFLKQNQLNYRCWIDKNNNT